MSNTCDINDVKRNLTVDPKDAIDIVAGDKIEVLKDTSGNKTVYTISYKEYAAPRITVNSAIYKVGVKVSDFTFNGNIHVGSSPILSRTMTPDKGLNLEAPFSWTENNILGTSNGLWPRFNGNPTKIKVIDSTGNEVEVSAGLEYRFTYYMGYSTKDTLTESDVKGLEENHLLTNVLSRYRNYTYNSSALPVFIYWVFPSDSPSFTEASEGPLPVPLKLDIPNIQITDEGITKSYRVIRTAVKTKLVNAKIDLK